MAWYSLYKWFIRFSKLTFENQITNFRRYLYDEWYNSLTDEEKERLKELEEAKKREEKRKFDQSMWTLMNIMSVVNASMFKIN